MRTTWGVGQRIGALIVAVSAAIVVGGTPALAQQVPPSPAPVAVSLSSASTALIVLDMVQQTCGSQANCQEMIPRVATLLANARSSGVLVVYSAPSPGGVLAMPVTAPAFLPDVAPVQGDPVVVGLGQDRFFGTSMDNLLRNRGITSLILVGWRENGSVLYTAVGGTLRNYTVVVADDGTSAAQDYDVAIGRYQLLTQLNANPNNEPLRKAAVTLSRTDLITFQ